MTVVVYDDVIVPDCVFTPSAGGSRTRLNDRGVNQAGYVTVNAIRDLTLKSYGLATITMTIEDFQEIIALYEVTDAGTFGMLLKDPVDSTVAVGQGSFIGYQSGVENGVVGFGNGTPTYGFRKVWQPSGSTRKKAVAVTRLNGAPSILRNGSPVTSGAAPGNISISTGPSYVTFVADSSSTVTNVTVGATTNVTLTGALAGLAIGGKLWLQGLGGADADLLNDKAHTITNLVGSVYTLSINTAGKTITAAGTGRKYPQATETLAWSGDFYVPVQFATDNLDWDLVQGGSYEKRLLEGPTISLIEVREA